MDFNDLGLTGAQGVVQRNRGVGIGTRIEDQDICGLRGLLNPVHQLAFGIGLAKRDFRTCSRGRHLLVNVVQRCGSVNLRLSRTEQVEIRTIENIYSSRHCLTLLRWIVKLGKSIVEHKE